MSVRIKIWDTAGQEKNKSLTKNFYKNSNGVIIVYDVSNRSSFNTIQGWIESVYDNSAEDIKIILIGNKIDLEREVSTEEGKAIADKYHIPFYETSAKENTNIKQSILDLVSIILETQEPKKEGINLSDKKVEEENNSSICKC